LEKAKDFAIKPLKNNVRLQRGERTGPLRLMFEECSEVSVEVDFRQMSGT
jgi:hypothetical protein